MAFHTRAFFICSWPKIAEKGKMGRVIAQGFLSPDCSEAAAIALLPSLAHEFKMLAWQENLALTHLLPINEGYGSGTDVHGLPENYADLADRPPSNADG
jgi:hypothetical protein